MRQFTSDEIQAQFDKLPQEVKDAITSTEVNDKVQAIAKKYNLLIDQTGELVDEIGLTMLGLSKSSDFTNNIMSRCSINRAVAQNIAQDVNTEIFGAIRTHMRQIEEKSRPEIERPIMSENITIIKPKPPVLSPLERAGNFEIEEGDDFGNGLKPNGLGTINGGIGTYAQTNKVNKIERNPLQTTPGTTPEITRESTKEGIKAEQHKVPPPSNLPGEKEIIGMTDEHTDALVDHLLKNPVATVEERVVRETPPSESPILDRKPGNDPYHEPI